MKPAKEIMDLFFSYIEQFKKNEKYIEYIKDQQSFAVNLYFTEGFTKEIEVSDIENIELFAKKYAIEFATAYAFMRHGEILTSDEEIIKKFPSLKAYFEDVTVVNDEYLVALKNMVLKVTNFCYENVSKAKYYNEFVFNLKTGQYYLEGNNELSPVVAFDLDGTVVNSNERIRILEENRANLPNNINNVEKGKLKFKLLKKFHSDTSLDKPYEHMLKLMDLFRQEGFEIMVLTARPDEHKNESLRFLEQHKIGVNLYVGRPVSNGVPDDKGKYSWLNENIAKERVRGFFEDRDSIIEYFQKKDKVHIYDVKEIHKNPSIKQLASIVKEAKGRKNKTEEMFLLKNEKENYKDFYIKADEYYQKRVGTPYSEVEKSKNRSGKFRPNIS